MTQIFAGLFTSRVASLAPPTQPPPPPANNTQLSPLPFHQDDHYSFLPPPFHPRRSNFPEEVLAHTHTHTHTHTTQPAMVVCKMEAQSEYVTRCTHVFARLGTDSHAQSVLIDKISASELRRKFIKSALLVGK